MIHVNQDVFYLSTQNTSYIFRVSQTGHLESLYYGRKIPFQNDFSFLGNNLRTGYGNTVAYSQADTSMSLEHLRLEYSTFGKGDYKEPSIQVEHPDSCYVSDFKYRSYEILKEKYYPAGLPSSYGDKAETLLVTVHDKALNADLNLYYTVFETCDVIVRSCKLINKGDSSFKIHNLMSAQVDLPPQDYTMLTFDGAWIRERHKNEKTLSCGTYSISSNIGTSSNRHNPFFALKEPECTEHNGNCYGFNLIYSGNHMARVEVSPHNITRIQNGINPFEFEWNLEAGQSFDTPESVMTFSSNGLNGMSQNMHKFVQDHIVRGEWQYKERPILVNNWEATYFFFNEKKILKLVDEAKSIGAEMFVLDDGWFGKRNNDKCSLGDWYVNTKKLPHGIDGLCKKVNAKGMMFGLWVEPEMVSPDSDLYRAHPDWAVTTDKYVPSQGRNQFVLDLTRDDVCDYLIDAMTNVFSMANIEYIKWDMNRHLSDIYSRQSGAHMGEFFHRYTLGLYRILDELVKRFPKILFESCSSGGNRFDLGMFCYMPQTWASDDTDSLERVKIQAGTSYGYPPSVIAAHVSGSPSYAAMRASDIENRFNVAAFGLLGYELDVTQLGKFDKSAIKKQIAYYKAHRKLFQFGKFIRLTDCFKSNVTYWQVVNKEQTESVLFHHINRHQVSEQTPYVKFAGLKEDSMYSVIVRQQGLSLKTFGEIIPSKIPGVEEDGALYTKVTDTIGLKTEKQSISPVSGEALMYAGFLPKLQFNGGGFSLTETRFMLDNSSRLYLAKEEAKQ